MSKIKKNNFNKFYKDYLFYYQNNGNPIKKYKYMFNKYFKDNLSIFKFIEADDVGKKYFISGC